MTVDHARAYLAAGWHPIPLPARSKKITLTGITGWNGKYLAAGDLDGYDWSGNIALRLPPDVVGLDVDVYAGGDVSLKNLEERFGPLPADDVVDVARRRHRHRAVPGAERDDARRPTPPRGST